MTSKTNTNGFEHKGFISILGNIFSHPALNGREVHNAAKVMGPLEVTLVQLYYILLKGEDILRICQVRFYIYFKSKISNFSSSSVITIPCASVFSGRSFHPLQRLLCISLTTILWGCTVASLFTPFFPESSSSFTSYAPS